MGSITDRILSGAPAPEATPIEMASTPSRGRLTSKILGEQAARAEETAPVAVYDPERSASPLAVSKASFLDSPARKIQLFAKERGISPSRYKNIGGRIAYQADSGEWLYEEPEGGWMVPFKSARDFASRAAAHVGEALPVGAGMLAGIATAPMMLGGPAGFAGSVGLTGAAQAAGEGVRQAIGAGFGDEADLYQVAKEGAMGTASQLGGGLLGKYAQRVYEAEMLRNIPRAEVARMKAKAPQIARLQRLAQQFGIELTPAELAGSARMKAQQEYLKNVPQSADIMSEFYARRGGQIEGAVGKALGEISPEASAEIAGRKVVEASKGAIKGARVARQSEAEPFYKSVVNPQSVVDDAGFAKISSDPFLADEIKRVQSGKLFGMEGMEPGSLPVLNQVKIEIDDAIRVATRAGKLNEARLLKGKRDILLGVTDKAFPEYPVARAAFAGKSPAVEKLEEGMVGAVSRIKDVNARKAADMLISGGRIGPDAAFTARKALEKQSPEAWQGVKRAWLSAQWGKAAKAAPEGKGPRFHKLLFGDPQQQAVLHNVLTPKEYRALSDLTEVLDATRAGTIRGPELGARDSPVSALGLGMLGDAGALVSIFRALRPANKARVIGKNAQRLAEVITSPRGAAILSDLRQIEPGTARWFAAAAKLDSEIGLFGPARADKE